MEIIYHENGYISYFKPDDHSSYKVVFVKDWKECKTYRLIRLNRFVWFVAVVFAINLALMVII